MSEDKKKPSIPNKPKFDKSLLKDKQSFKQQKGLGKPTMSRNVGRGR